MVSHTMPFLHMQYYALAAQIQNTCNQINKTSQVSGVYTWSEMTCVRWGDKLYSLTLSLPLDHRSLATWARVHRSPCGFLLVINSEHTADIAHLSLQNCLAVVTFYFDCNWLL